LYDTDGSVGAAKGAGIGAGIYANADEAFASLEKLQVIEPKTADQAAYAEAYARWKEVLKAKL
jgi:xylulokinase